MPSPEALLEDWRARIAQATRERPLRLRGAGSKDFYGEQLTGDVLELRDFSGIIAYEPSELVITARCGTASISPSNPPPTGRIRRSVE
jgi:glycolate oxidase FAD binding subunit